MKKTLLRIIKCSALPVAIRAALTFAASKVLSLYYTAVLKQLDATTLAVEAVTSMGEPKAPYGFRYSEAAIKAFIALLDATFWSQMLLFAMALYAVSPVIIASMKIAREKKESVKQE